MIIKTPDIIEYFIEFPNGQIKRFRWTEEEYLNYIRNSISEGGVGFSRVYYYPSPGEQRDLIL